jgi:nucleotide-binding universal stress UspA family protein
MFKKIVLALDGSSSSDRAIEVARNLVAGSSASLVAVHVVEFIGGSRGSAVPTHPDEDEIQRKIGDQVRALAKAGTSAELRTVDTMLGGPARAIADAAKEANADLIVTGTRGHSAIAGLMVGSVVQRLLHFATCPVLVVPPAAEDEVPR